MAVVVSVREELDPRKLIGAGAADSCGFEGAGGGSGVGGGAGSIWQVLSAPCQGVAPTGSPFNASAAPQLPNDTCNVCCNRFLPARLLRGRVTSL